MLEDFFKINCLGAIEEPTNDPSKLSIHQLNIDKVI